MGSVLVPRTRDGRSVPGAVSAHETGVFPRGTLGNLGL
jgi:hypothetical protein